MALLTAAEGSGLVEMNCTGEESRGEEVHTRQCYAIQI